ncbi:MAG: hypothetical protein JNK48_00435 [Bryobacterales bacterium]|nr:hypothetical protein [Bryobacterales bacterium]
MKHLVPALALLALAGCGESSAGLQERINTADEAFAPQLLSGFYHIEEHSWRWTKPSFAVALKPPRKAPLGAVLILEYSLPQPALDRLKEVTIAATVDGVPLPAEKCTRTGLLEMRRDIPAVALSGKSGVKVEFHVSPHIPATPDDKRDLGLIVHSVGLVKKQ